MLKAKVKLKVPKIKWKEALHKTLYYTDSNKLNRPVICLPGSGGTAIVVNLSVSR